MTAYDIIMSDAKRTSTRYLHMKYIDQYSEMGGWLHHWYSGVSYLCGSEFRWKSYFQGFYMFLVVYGHVENLHFGDRPSVFLFGVRFCRLGLGPIHF